ncbi:histidine kinase [Desulfitobacterium hafniense DCB-2]|uniref:histidine kinase n=2 Tax=root TaxID=1 RepID=B8FSH2_DESHD|nr:HAMP domain-containing sensor histidine kinase [Desulfitobacterium hafniense]ACL21960.1 histidine kinase [Desulfitobacterium hafniense DCB-2]MEA5022590.1 HAMP domain-containing sensor histidine kinase [Desulfitobacterium hafniense]
MLPWILCAGLSLAVAVLCVKIRLLHQSMDEIRVEFKERLTLDTNTLISISSTDPRARRLAADINTQLRLLRRQRRHYLNGDRELKEAVTNISHDLRTPLTAICGYLELLEEEEKSAAAARYLAFIANRTETLKQLTEELFRYSLILAARDTMQMELLSVKGVLEESLAAVYPALLERRITPVVHLPEQPVKRRLDKGALSRIFGNILNNALKYSDGDLEVRLRDNGEVLFTNTAAALDEVQVGKLFNRFFTVEAARHSTGLGLAIAKTLVEQMNGEITAHYREQKLSICIRFPLAEPD